MNDRLRVASILLGHLITSDRGKDLRVRLPEVRHCIDLADLLIGLCETSSPASTELGIGGIGSSGDTGSDDDNEAGRPPLLAKSMTKQIYERRRAGLQQRQPRNGSAPH